MFPSLRLMIAATFASIVALICGFGMFAAFRVSHEPLARLPPATAAPPLRIDSAVTLSVTAAEPFAHRFQIGAPGDGGGLSSSLSVLAYSAAPPTEQPATKAVEPAEPVAHEREADTSEPAPAPVVAADAPAPIQQAAAAEAPADAKPDEPVRQAPSDDAAGEVKPDAGAEPSGAQAPAAAPSVAAVEPSTTEPAATAQVQPAEASPASSPAPSVAPPPDAAHGTAVKSEQRSTKRPRLTAAAHRMHAARASAVAHAGAVARTQDPKRTSTFPGTTFETGAQSWPPPAQRQPARGDRTRAAARTTTSNTTAGIGGPFVSAPDP